MFVVTATKNSLSIQGSELLTSGSVNINFVQVITSNDWRGLMTTIVFQTRGTTVTIGLGIDSGAPMTIAIPWEVLTTAGETINVGLYGMTSAESENENQLRVVLPTIWGTLGKVTQGVVLSGGSPPKPSKDLFAEFINRIDGFEGIIQDIQMNGIYEHSNLRQRDADDQHPISAIAGLQEKLDDVIMPSDLMTSADLEAMLGTSVSAHSSQGEIYQNGREGE